MHTGYDFSSAEEAVEYMSKIIDACKAHAGTEPRKMDGQVLIIDKELLEFVERVINRTKT